MVTIIAALFTPLPAQVMLNSLFKFPMDRADNINVRFNGKLFRKSGVLVFKSLLFSEGIQKRTFSKF
jgi:hypothetical protein